MCISQVDHDRVRWCPTNTRRRNNGNILQVRHNDEQGGAYNNGLIQPILNYNFPGFYLNSAPMATVNWEADSGNQWTVPLGGGIGKIFHFGKLPVNTSLQAYYNVVTPDNGADWQIRFQVQFMFPK